jgi:hypothetical protein
MRRVVWQNASILDIKTGIPRTQIFLTTHPLVFTDVTNALEVDHWLCTMESRFGLLHYTEFQKTLYVAQQL